MGHQPPHQAAHLLVIAVAVLIGQGVGLLPQHLSQQVHGAQLHAPLQNGHAHGHPGVLHKAQHVGLSAAGGLVKPVPADHPRPLQQL